MESFIERLKAWIADMWKRMRPKGGGGPGEPPK